MLVTFIVSVVVFPVTSARYTGFIYIGFLVAYWLYSYEDITNRKNKWIINSLLVIQVLAGLFSIAKDIRLPFSNLDKVNQLLRKVPENKKTITDYWALNAVSTFSDKPFYAVDMQKEMLYIVWDGNFASMLQNPDRYTRE